MNNKEIYTQLSALIDELANYYEVERSNSYVADILTDIVELINKLN